MKYNKHNNNNNKCKIQVDFVKPGLSFQVSYLDRTQGMVVLLN
jgi:hypothetical protein